MIDMWRAMKMAPNRHTMNNRGETFYPYPGKSPYHYFFGKNKNAEEIFLGNDGWVWRGHDTSPNQFEAYATWTDASQNTWGHRWTPRYVNVGDKWDSTAYVLFFDKRSGNAMVPTKIGMPGVDQQGGYLPTYRMEVTSFHDTYRTDAGREFQNVVKIKTSTYDGTPFELFTFAYGWGMVEWQSLMGENVFKTYVTEKNDYPQSALWPDIVIDVPAIPHLFKEEDLDFDFSKLNVDAELSSVSGVRNIRHSAVLNDPVVFKLQPNTSYDVRTVSDLGDLVSNNGYYWLPFVWLEDLDHMVEPPVMYVAVTNANTPRLDFVSLVQIPETPDEPEVPDFGLSLTDEERLLLAKIVESTANSVIFSGGKKVFYDTLNMIADWVRNANPSEPPDDTNERSRVGLSIDCTSHKVNLDDVKAYLLRLRPVAVTVINGTDLVKWIRANLPDTIVVARYIWKSREDEPHIMTEHHNDWRPLLDVLRRENVPVNDPMILVDLCNEPSMATRDKKPIDVREFLRWDISLQEFMIDKGYYPIPAFGIGKNIIAELVPTGAYDEWIDWYAAWDRVVGIHNYYFAHIALADSANYPENLFDANAVRPENWPTELDTAHQFSVWGFEHIQRRCEQRHGKRLRVIITEGPQSDNIGWAQEHRLPNGRTVKEQFIANGWGPADGNVRGDWNLAPYYKAMLNWSVARYMYTGQSFFWTHANALGGYIANTLFMVTDNPEWVANGYNIWNDEEFKEALVNRRIF